MANQEALVMEVPTALVENSGGFSLDWGGSAIKVLYLHKEDGEKLFKDEVKPSKTKIRLAIYPVSQSKEALSMLKNNCYIIREKDACPLVYITGTGCSVNENTIANDLGVRCTNMWEVDNFVKGLYYMVNSVPYNSLVHTPTAAMRRVFEGTTKASQICLDLWTKKLSTDLYERVWNKTVRDHPDGPMAQTVPDVFPCVMFVLSSVFWSVMIHNDGGYTITGTFQCGGHPFLGLGSLVCGSLKTFDELIDLAEKGDLAKVDDFFAELLNEGKEDNYGGIIQPGFMDFPLYPLRKVSCQGPDTGRLEDRLLSLLRSTCMSIAMTIINTMIIRKVKHAFLVGSFASRKLVRQLLEAEFHRQRVILGYTMNGEGLDCEIHFPKTAAYLGALGAFINHTDPKQPVYK